MVGNTVRVTKPSRSSPRKVSVSIRCEMLPSARRISLKRFGPLPSSPTTRMVHLSPTRDRSSGTCRLLGINFVPSCLRRGVIYLASVSSRNQQPEGNMAMAQFKVALIVGSNRRESVNRKLAQALAKLGAPGLEFQFVQIDDLPLYNQDDESNLPASVVRFKSEI